MNSDWAYDIETYPNVFTVTFINISTGETRVYEYSYRRNDIPQLFIFLSWLRENNCRLVGFNNVGFDYPVLHFILTYPDVTVTDIYNKAMEIINGDKFNNMIWDNERFIEQIDLYKIHHFDNVARATSLKVLEFNMRSDNIKDLPYKPGTLLQPHEIDVLINYNIHDVKETIKFYHQSTDQIKFREELTEKYDKNFMNHADTKIGKDFFIMQLGRKVCYDGRNPRQTPRNTIPVRDIIFPYIQFEHPEFQRILEWFKNQIITNTKSAFKDLSCVVDGFEFVFGTGGLHGSIDSQVAEGNIIDIDVKSYYPNIAIANNLYPEHLGEKFCEIYQDVYDQRSQYAKGTAENAILKLALNGVYGDSNSVYSPFYDPQYTMSITINGQLLLCMLAEQLMRLPGVKMIQANTDGITVQTTQDINPICQWWEQLTGLELEHISYIKMAIRDVNSYIAQYTDGRLKRKGAYEHDVEWHQNHSALVVPKAAEAVLIRGITSKEAVTGHTDLMDFMLRTRVPRSSRLMYGDTQIQNVSRYYIATQGEALTKIMPPTPAQIKKNPAAPERRIGINVGYVVQECNDITDFNPALINYEWYIKEVDKLVSYAHTTHNN